ncbi:MAG: hypothetical protein ACR2IK_03215 [Chloroflexota bacterium]
MHKSSARLLGVMVSRSVGGRAMRLVLAALVAGWVGSSSQAFAQSNDQADPGVGAASAELETALWSGWWWPASNALGPTLFALGSPLDKYDQYVAMVTGQNPGARAWERQELYFPGSPWAGHCNGFAAAALLEPEPTDSVSIFDIPFSVADQKGLLVDYHFADAAAWSFGDDGQLDPADFQRMLLSWVQGAGKGFVVTYDMGNGEVWSYPLYRFESEWSVDPVDPEQWHVKTIVWMADMDVPADFVGSKPYPGPAGKTFEYTLQGDPTSPVSGAWTGASRTGRFAHPGRIWYPEASVRNADRELVSPALDRQTIANILAGSDGSDVVVPPAPAPTVRPTAGPRL